MAHAIFGWPRWDRQRLNMKFKIGKLTLLDSIMEYTIKSQENWEEFTKEITEL